MTTHPNCFDSFRESSNLRNQSAGLGITHVTARWIAQPPKAALSRGFGRSVAQASHSSATRSIAGLNSALPKPRLGNGIPRTGSASERPIRVDQKEMRTYPPGNREELQVSGTKLQPKWGPLACVG
jgi:anti-sigma factor RsiW